MPYITPQARERIGDITMGSAPETCGELNYVFTLFIKQYMETKGLSYQTCNDIVGALDGAKAEFQDRVVRPYEDEKIRENGDVYDVT